MRAVDLSFASEAWQRLIVVRRGRRKLLLRRPFEVCVFSHLATELQAGDLAVEGSHAHADYREQLLPWEACAPQVAEYCARLGFPASAVDFVAGLHGRLAAVARRVDAEVPTNESLARVSRSPGRAGPRDAVCEGLPQRTLQPRRAVRCEGRERARTNPVA